MFIVQLLEEMDLGHGQTLQQTNKSMSPAATMEGSGSFADDGKGLIAISLFFFKDIK